MRKQYNYYHMGGAPSRRRRYGLLNFIFDAIMTCLTGGFWLIWVFVREMRNR